MNSDKELVSVDTDTQLNNPLIVASHYYPQRETLAHSSSGPFVQSRQHTPDVW